ncbi:RHS repeat-associated core domain-containing protein [Marinilabiliaceae bacterium JC017]|nr:RHS repeat-associated core domain-containing protein [Marinilabiliaceae bacterium JC017]
MLVQYNDKQPQNDANEESNLDWYDYGARFYDPALGRWHVPDPLCEYHFNKTPYHYVLNNPINYVDPLGLKEKKARKHWWQFWRPKMKPVYQHQLNADIVVTPKKKWKQGGVTMSGGNGSPGVEGRDAPYIGDINTLPGMGMGKPSAHSRGVTFWRSIRFALEKIANSFFSDDNQTSDEDIVKTKTGENTTLTDKSGGTSNIEKQRKIVVKKKKSTVVIAEPKKEVYYSINNETDTIEMIGGG